MIAPKTMTPTEAEAQRLGREIPRSRAERERAEDRRPVEELAPAREDAADRERALLAVPSDEDAGEGNREHGRAEIQAHAEAVGERVGDLRADDADEHH